MVCMYSRTFRVLSSIHQILTDVHDKDASNLRFENIEIFTAKGIFTSVNDESTVQLVFRFSTLKGLLTSYPSVSLPSFNTDFHRPTTVPQSKSANIPNG